MKICLDHWHEMRNAIRQRGLWKLVTQQGSVAAQNSQAEVGAWRMSSTFDPLIAESSMISEQALMALGSPLASSHDCPLCSVEQSLGAETVLEWIETDADIILQLCRAQKLVTSDEF
jgi:hypothetical protein